MINLQLTTKIIKPFRQLRGTPQQNKSKNTREKQGRVHYLPRADHSTKNQHSKNLFYEIPPPSLHIRRISGASLGANHEKHAPTQSENHRHDRGELTEAAYRIRTPNRLLQAHYQSFVAAPGRFWRS